MGEVIKGGNTIFGKIIRKEIPATVLYEDDKPIVSALYKLALVCTQGCQAGPLSLLVFGASFAKLCIVFNDVNPQAPVHFLVVPIKPIEKLSDTEDSDGELLGHLMLVARKVAKEQKLENGFRLVINNGEDGGQTVFQLHIHVLGKRYMDWPPG